MTVPSVPAPATPSSAKTATSSTAAPRLKLVIRRLPPTLPEEIFWNSVTPWLGDVIGKSDGESKVSWKRYVKGKAVSDTNQHRVFSRAYLQMKTTEDLTQFAQAYDGHVFRGKDGQEFQAVVEFAPAQKIPTFKSKPRLDARQGTIDSDADFLSFLESLKAPIVKQDINNSELIPEQPKSTPLLDHLRETRQAKKPSSAGRSSTVDGRSGGKDKGKNKDKPSKPKDSGGSKSAGAGGKKDQPKSGGGGKGRDPPQSLPANREPVKIQVNPNRQPGPPAGKVQILQRAPTPAGSKPAPGQPIAGPSSTPPPPKGPKQPQNSRNKPSNTSNNDQDNKGGRGKPKDPSTSPRQRPERGAKSLLSVALNASTAQQQGSGANKGNDGPKASVSKAAGSQEKDGSDADKKKKTRRGGQGQGKKKAEGDDNSEGGPRAGTPVSATARIDD